MQIRNLRLDVSMASTATYATTAGTLTGIGSLTGKAFQSVRVKQDETGFETTYKALIENKAAGNYTIALGDTDAMLVFGGDANVTLPSNATANLPVGANVAFTALGTITFVADAGVTIVKNAALTLVSTGEGAVQQAKKIAANTWLLFGDLVAA